VPHQVPKSRFERLLRSGVIAGEQRPSVSSAASVGGLGHIGRRVGLRYARQLVSRNRRIGGFQRFQLSLEIARLECPKVSLANHPSLGPFDGVMAPSATAAVIAAIAAATSAGAAIGGRSRCTVRAAWCEERISFG
jgi:hypothetical protein